MHQNVPFSTQNSKNFIGRGADPQTFPTWEEETPSQHLTPFGTSILVLSALDHRPLAHHPRSDMYSLSRGDCRPCVYDILCG